MINISSLGIPGIGERGKLKMDNDCSFNINTEICFFLKIFSKRIAMNGSHRSKSSGSEEYCCKANSNLVEVCLILL
jgi:hypothetical protein